MQNFETVVGGPFKLILTWNDCKIARMTLAWKGTDDRDDYRSPEAGKLAAALVAYAAGENTAWPELPLDFSGIRPFTLDVLDELAKVSFGHFLTYGELAARVGSPKAAHAVGQVMAKNRFPLIFPCHRVVGRGMNLTGYGPGLPMKKMLLELEGVLTASST
jgi:methylated-DNA-[protein]-cysteine S-methyltransferase